MLQQIIVLLIVGLAAAYALWRWMPRAWRQAAVHALASRSQRAGLVDAERASQLASALTRSSGCGACDDCGGCKTPTRVSADRAQPTTE